MTTNEKEVGRLAEKIAGNYLKKRGYKILSFNYRKPWGEIDIIAQKEKAIVFVEVKSKSKKKGNYGFPEERINKVKKEKIVKTAQGYLSENNLQEVDWQIDVIAVDLNFKTRKAGLKHFKNAVTG